MEKGKDDKEDVDNGQACLYHYTSFRWLLYILQKKCLPMKSPEYWDDKNDSALLLKTAGDDEKVGAFCMTRSKKNTSFRWFMFGRDDIGVRIAFDQKKIKSLKNQGIHLSGNEIKYITKKKLRETIKNKNNPAFIKRFAYADEMEYRMVCYSKNIIKDNLVAEVPIDLGLIQSIRFSPYVSKEVFEWLKAQLEKEYFKGKKVKITKSRILDDQEWLDLLKKESLNAERI